jgi:hypothetical protein
MFLTYGRAQPPFGKDVQGEFVHVSEAKRGDACGLACPFCEGALTAKQGDVVGHHFAHQADTCRPASASAEDFIPSYEGYFIRGLSPAQRRVVEDILKRQGDGRRFFDAHSIHLTTLRALEAMHFLDVILVSKGRGRYRDVLACATNKALAFGCRLSLVEYAAFMWSEFRRSTASLEKQDDPEASIARRMLELEIARVEQTALYLLRIEAGGRLIHKIGITARPIEARIAEVEAFLKERFGKLAITPLFYLPSVPYVEGYFKARYAARRVRIGPATEYFDLGEEFDRAQAELTSLALAVEKGLAPKTARFRGTLNRPRFRAVFAGYSREFNDYRHGYDLVMRLDDVAYLDTGERFAVQQAFVVGTMLESLVGTLRRGDVVEFNAAERYGKLIRPTKVALNL